jgi:hypothetical protein
LLPFFSGGVETKRATTTWCRYFLLCVREEKDDNNAPLSFFVVLLQQRRRRHQALESNVCIMLESIYLDDIKHSWASHKTFLTMWSLRSGPIHQEILRPSVWEKEEDVLDFHESIMIHER